MVPIERQDSRLVAGAFVDGRGDVAHGFTFPIVRRRRVILCKTAKQTRFGRGLGWWRGSGVTSGLAVIQVPPGERPDSESRCLPVKIDVSANAPDLIPGGPSACSGDLTGTGATRRNMMDQIVNLECTTPIRLKAATHQ